MPGMRSPATQRLPPLAAPAAGRVSLTQAATDHIRQAIVEGSLALGEALSELGLARALGVSRTPVREALGALQRDGLLDVRPQAGSFVFLPTAEDVAELAEFRRVLESAALRLALARRREGLIAALRLAVDAMARAASDGDRAAASRADTAFHQALVDHCANQHLIESYRLVSGRVAALLAHNLSGPGVRRSTALAEHRAILASLVKADLAQAMDILDQHVLNFRHRYQEPGRGRTGGVS
jgi:DNA-binding GntR family transcriptional regulator